ncbi:hypothetical protein D3C77_414710 [compost metagenome]
MRAEQIPLAASFDRFHVQVRDADAVEHIVGTHTLVTVIQLQIEESEDIFMENIQVYRNSSFTSSELIDADGSVVQLANPRDDAGACVLMATDI